jgi:hypothetical protein
MKGVAKLFDYFKLAFHLNNENRRLYLPQIVLIFLKAGLYLVFGVYLYRLMVSFGDSGFSWEIIKSSFKSLVWRIGGIILFASLAAIVVEAGLFNMYKICIQKGKYEYGAFSEGVRKNFIRFLLADFLMILAWMLMLIPYIIIGVLSLFAGFVLIPLLISIFTIMWKASMVVEDVFVIEGLKRGFRFAKRHFVSLSVLVILKAAFLSVQGGGSSGGGSASGSSANLSNWNWSSQKYGATFTDKAMDGFKISDMSFHEAYMQALSYIKIGFYILIPIVGIAIIVASLIRMVFEIFFGLATFIMYIENTKEASDEAALGVK